MFVAGTAGHVDHGKSTLIQALTGINPDRLEQEQTRGMTIELGFAWLTLDNGTRLSIVDVPGHERFVRHMIMGAGGFDIALLVVAADEGIMAQTEEHVAILDLLEVRNGIVVVTKVDAADSDLAELVELEVADLLEGTSLEGSPTVRVSATDGLGLSELRQVIQQATELIEPRIDRNEPRMYVDRSFNITGFGTVLTGTLDRGELSTGDEVELLPLGSRGRIRGLQTHQESVRRAEPGNRVAVNVNGFGHAQVSRGEALVRSTSYDTTAVFDATVRTISNSPRPIRHNHKVTVYAGTWEEPGTVRLLNGDSLAAGETGFAQIVIAGKRPLAVADRFVLRDTNDTLGGGAVLVLDAPRHRRNDGQVTAQLARLRDGSSSEFVLQHLELAGVSSLVRLARLSGGIIEDLSNQLDQLCETGNVVKLMAEGVQDRLFVTRDGWNAIRRMATETLATYHLRFPLRAGMPRQALRSALGLDSDSFEATAAQMVHEGELETSGTSLKLAGFNPTFTDEQESQAKSYIQLLRDGGYAPPSGLEIDVEVLSALVARQEVVAAGDVVFEAGKFHEMRAGVVGHCRSQGEVSINDVREMFNTSRKYSLALLEQLDRDNVTIRVGDLRKLK